MMMHMPWLLVALIVFLVLVSAAAFVAVRAFAASSTKNDHPR